MTEAFNSNFRETDDLMQIDSALSGGLSDDIATGRIFGAIPPSNPTSTLSAVAERAIRRANSSAVDDPLNDSGPSIDSSRRIDMTSSYSGPDDLLRVIESLAPAVHEGRYFKFRVNDKFVTLSKSFLANAEHDARWLSDGARHFPRLAFFGCGPVAVSSSLPDPVDSASVHEGEPTPLQRAAGGEGEAAALIRRAAAPWSPPSHSLFPAAARAREALLVRSLYEIHDRQLDRPNGIAARDFVACVLRFAITRETE